MWIRRQQPAEGDTERPRHAEVHQESSTRCKSDNQILAAPLDVGDALVDEVCRDDIRVEWPRQPWIEDRRALDSRTLQCGRDSAAYGLDLRKLGHRPSVDAGCR